MHCLVGGQRFRCIWSGLVKWHDRGPNLPRISYVWYLWECLENWLKVPQLSPWWWQVSAWSCRKESPLQLKLFAPPPPPLLEHFTAFMILLKSFQINVMIYWFRLPAAFHQNKTYMHIERIFALPWDSKFGKENSFLYKITRKPLNGKNIKHKWSLWGWDGAVTICYFLPTFLFAPQWIDL